MISKRISRLINYNHDLKIKKVYVLSNNGFISKELIKRLKEHIDTKYININEIKDIDGLSEGCLVLSDGWYMTDKNKNKGLCLIKQANKIFEIGLDDF